MEIKIALQTPDWTWPVAPAIQAVGLEREFKGAVKAVRVAGFDVATQPAEVRRQIGGALQEAAPLRTGA